MEVRILYFEGCPNFEPTYELVSRTMREFGIEGHPVSYEVHNEADAAQAGFLGSPTVQVNGLDIEVSRRGDAPLFGCRIYAGRNGQTGVPPRELVAAALEAAR